MSADPWRKRDVIDVTIVDEDGPTILSQSEAWADLVRVVSARHGVDLNGPNPFRVMVLPIASNSNHRMSAFLAYPKACKELTEIMANAAMSLFGEVSEALSGCDLAHADLLAIATQQQDHR
jgi:hypothetical protein